MKGGNFNPTPIDRVNKSISNSNTYRLTYKCYTFLFINTFTFCEFCKSEQLVSENEFRKVNFGK